MSTVDRAATVGAAPEAVWAVLADFGALSRWVPMIQHSCLLSDQQEGVGTVRRVQIARQTLVERVTAWQPGERLAYSIDGLPPIVGTVSTTWTLARATEGGTDVTLTTEIPTGPNPVKRFVAGRVLARMATASELMLAGLAEEATDDA